MQRVGAGHISGARAMEFEKGFLKTVVGLRNVHREAQAKTIQTRRHQLVQSRENHVVAHCVALHERAQRVGFHIHDA
jgi:hypothetical protein